MTPRSIAHAKRAHTRDSQLLTARQVMERLLADVRFGQREVMCVLPAIRYGSEFRFLESDLDDWMRRQKQSRSAPIARVSRR